MGGRADMKVDVQWPDGIRRDRERTRESLAFIRQHPVWYFGVMLGRMWGMLKVAGDPVPYCGVERNQRDEQKVFAAALAGRRTCVWSECAGQDPECCAVSVFAVGCVGDLCCSRELIGG